MSEVERIAREAVALCADLLRRCYSGHATGAAAVVTVQQVDDWGRQVLAWQDQLDQPSRVPRVWKKGDPEPPKDVVLLRDCDGRAWRKDDYRQTWFTDVPLPVGYDIHALLCDYGPLTEVIQGGSYPDGGADD